MTTSSQSAESLRQSPKSHFGKHFELFEGRSLQRAPGSLNRAFCQPGYFCQGRLSPFVLLSHPFDVASQFGSRWYVGVRNLLGIHGHGKLSLALQGSIRVGSLRPRHDPDRKATVGGTALWSIASSPGGSCLAPRDRAATVEKFNRHRSSAGARRQLVRMRPPVGPHVRADQAATRAELTNLTFRNARHLENLGAVEEPIAGRSVASPGGRSAHQKEVENETAFDLRCFDTAARVVGP